MVKLATRRVPIYGGLLASKDKITVCKHNCNYVHIISNFVFQLTAACVHQMHIISN